VPPDAPASVPATPAVPAEMDAMRVYRRLLSYALPYWRMFLVGVLGMALFAGVDTGFVWLIKQFLNAAFVEQNRAVLGWLPAGIVALFFVRGVGDYLSTYGTGWVGRQVVKRIRTDLFRHYLDLPAAFYDRTGSAQLLSRLTYNTELVAEAATNGVTVLIRDALSITGLLGYLLYTNWRLTLFALAVALMHRGIGIRE
jgi:subfamily B ATP-binding cassette protein MsbA